MSKDDLKKLKKDEEAGSGRGRRRAAASKYSPEDAPRENLLKSWCGEFADIAPIYFAAEVLLGVRCEGRITKESAWMAINKFVSEAIESGRYDNLLRLHKIFCVVSGQKKQGKDALDSVRMRLIFINDWLMVRRSTDPGAFPEVTKSEILKICRKNFPAEFGSLEDSDAYRYMRALGLPRQPDRFGQIAMGKAMLGEGLFNSLLGGK
ncbi:hypothetical protein EBX31_06295 [bacterium]|nr:hypothetical protein [bacterium]